MKKNSRKSKNVTAARKHDGPGRPKYEPVFPRTKEWSFTDFMEVNGININSNSKDFGKGPNCTMLTLRKFMARDAKKMGHSLIVKIKGVTSEPNSKDGLGRRAYLYSLRAKANVKRASAPKSEAPAAADVVTPHDDVSDATKRYEELKSILAVPTPAPAAVVIPAVTITPEATPAPAPAPDPVVEAPAAPVAETTPAAEPVAS